MGVEATEAVAALDGNKYFEAIKEWMVLCCEANLDATRYPGSTGSEDTFRSLGAYHGMCEMFGAIVEAPDEYRKSHGG